MKSIFVVGGGTMGCGIAQLVAAAGMTVVLRDISADLTAVAQRTIETRLAKAVAKGHIADETMRGTLGRIQTTEDLAGAADADLVIETIPENIDLKKNLFCALDDICSSTIVLATNTSALSISAIAAATRHPNRVLGIHFFNPVPVMKLVELIKGDETSEETLMRARKFITCIGKIPIDVKDTPGFVVNRLLIPMVNEAICAYDAGIATAEDIDTAMQLGAGHPMGPLALADRIGLDVILKVMETLEEAFDDPKYHPSALLRQMVAEGKLGRKSKQGFYSYTDLRPTK